MESYIVVTRYNKYFRENTKLEQTLYTVYSTNIKQSELLDMVKQLSVHNVLPFEREESIGNNVLKRFI